jgi:rubrerythrin
MARYIDAEVLKRKLIDEKHFFPAIVARAIEDTPTADVEEVKHGEWEDRDGKTWCSLCGQSNKQYKPPYCPHCGAKMDGGKKK